MARNATHRVANSSISAVPAVVSECVVRLQLLVQLFLLQRRADRANPLTKSMTLTLRYHTSSSIPVEIEGLTPDAVRTKPLGDIERFEIYHGNQKLALAEMFHLSGDASDGEFDFEGDLAGVHWIGAHMASGTIRVHGNAGRHVGSEMTGGEILVEGDASDWVGGEMHGGKIHVWGRAGHLIGAAYRGSAVGMTGGTILIEGDVGNEVGHTMRRGWITVGGDAGDMIGFNMIAGTIFVFGNSGIRPGAGMRRGTIGLFGQERPELLPTFRHACRIRPQALQMMFRDLASEGMDIDAALRATDFELFNGDMIEGGRGELLLRA